MMRSLYARFGAAAMLLVMLLGTACAPLLKQAGAYTEEPPSGTPQAQVPSTGGKPAVSVSDQEFDGTTVVVADVVSNGPGWMVIHSQENGTVGPPIGFSPVKDGDNKNVAVKVDPNQATPVMYAMLHTDAGQVGVYEFPGPDAPVFVDNQMLTPPFKATKHSDTAGIVPLVVVKDQQVTNGSVTINEVDSPGPGWVAIHVENPDGTAGTDIGFIGVKAGKNMNVVVTVDPAKVTPVMFAMLHTDAGEVGMYEFPGPDAPLQYQGQMVAPAFSSNGQPLPNDKKTPIAMSVEMGTPAATTSSASAATATTAPSAAVSAPVAAAPSATAGADMAMGSPSGGANPMLMVADQALNNGKIKVDQVVSNGPGWVVIYTTGANGQPDQAIGHAAVPNGDSRNVLVGVDPAKANGKLVAQLHVDAGQVGTFEFPGPDAPLMMGVQMISGIFNVTPAQANNPPAAKPPAPTAIVPFVRVADQPIIDSAVTIPEVVSDGPAWLVLHRQNGDGTMGGMVGYTAVKPGTNTNVKVKVDTNATSTTLYAMLHADLGIKGKLEYPGPDMPVMANNEMVNVPFLVTASNSGDVVVNLSKNAGNKFLVNGQDMSLYISLKDAPGRSNCTGDCLTTWHPLVATGRIIAGSGVASDKLGILILQDGSRQVTFAGAPLYTYTKDANPGETKGQGLDGTWFLVNP